MRYGTQIYKTYLDFAISIAMFHDRVIFFNYHDLWNWSDETKWLLWLCGVSISPSVTARLFPITDEWLGPPSLVLTRPRHDASATVARRTCQLTQSHWSGRTYRQELRGLAAWHRSPLSAWELCVIWMSWLQQSEKYLMNDLMSIIWSRRPDRGVNGRWWNVNVQHIHVANTINPPPPYIGDLTLNLIAPWFTHIAFTEQQKTIDFEPKK